VRAAAERAWQSHVSLHGRSFFTENFQGQSVRKARCQRCGRLTVDFPAFQFLPLAPPPNQSTVRFVDLFARLPRRHCTKAWKCACCGGKEPCDDIVERVWKLPNLLMVLIQRVMKTKNGKLVKNKTEVWIPREGLDLSSLACTQGVPYIRPLGSSRRQSPASRHKPPTTTPEDSSTSKAKEDDTKKAGVRRESDGEASAPAGAEDGDMDYDLYAILAHTGTPHRGHYVAHVRNLRSGAWHTFNDGKIRGCDIRTNVIQSKDVYVLFFQRRKFAAAMGKLKIPGEPLTFDEWREKTTTANGGKRFGFVANTNMKMRQKPC